MIDSDNAATQLAALEARVVRYARRLDATKRVALLAAIFGRHWPEVVKRHQP